MSIPLHIVSMGKYLPERRVSSAELETRMDLEPGFIETRSGVAFRHFAGPGESNSTLGAKALQQALDRAGMAFEDLDLLLNASGSYDYPIPDTACLIQRALGKGDSGVPCFTIDATCLSFLSALDVAAAFLASGRYRRIAIVSSEVASRSLNYQEWESASLLGDGAAAAIVEARPGSGSALLSARMETYGSGAFHTYVAGGGNVRHPLQDDVQPEEYTFAMNGLAVLTTAFRRLRGFNKQLFAGLDFSLQEVDLFVPHQASGVALEKAQQLFRLRDDQFVANLHTHGNCIAASIPMALFDALEAGRLQRGMRVCLLGTGAGLSLGGAVLIF